MQTKVVYVETQSKNYKPFNIIPSNSIKCSHCNAYVSAQQMQIHSQIHVQKKYLDASTSKINTNKVKKLDLNSILNSQTGLDDINIRSFLPQQMPTAEIVRKQALQKPQGLQSKNKQLKLLDQSIYKGFNKHISIKQDNLDLQSHLPYQQQIIQHHQPIQFSKQVKLSKQSIPILSKNIQVYTNQKQVNKNYINNVVIQAKNIKPKQPEDKQNYVEQYYNVYPNQIKKQTKGNLPTKIQIKSAKRSPAFKQMISTISTTGSQFFKGVKKRGFIADDCTEEGDKNQIHQMHVRNKFQCDQCKGFYCKTCGSDIPPIFRPVGNKNKQKDQIANFQQSKLFYKSHVFNKSQGKTSRVTGCTNCQ